METTESRPHSSFASRAHCGGVKKRHGLYCGGRQRNQSARRRR
ncbi:MAG: hypothetical protein QXP31_05890 [Pyrobaculum sp.]